jgi:uncharacterized damage-inducible protein DinB
VVKPDEINEVLVETYAANDRMNQLLLEHIDQRAWHARPPGSNTAGRTIAAIFAHLHNNRLVWVERSAPHLTRPPALDPNSCTIQQAAELHRESASRCLQMLTEALSSDECGRVIHFSRRTWAHTWRAGATMFAYMFAHEAHHRGQIIAK